MSWWNRGRKEKGCACGALGRDELHIWMRKLGRGSRGCDIVRKIATKEVHDSRSRLWKRVSLEEQTTEVEGGEVLVGDYVTM